MIPYIDSRLRAWVSWRIVAKPRLGAAGYYAYRTVLGDLRKEGSTSQGAVAGGSRTRAVTASFLQRLLDEDREPLECELVVRHMPEHMARIVLLWYAGVCSLAGLDRLDGKPQSLSLQDLELVLGMCRASVYNHLQAAHTRTLDDLNEPRLDALVERLAERAAETLALDTIRAFRQNTRHSAKVAIGASAA